MEAIQHRFAYVGADLQDIYGVNPTTIVRGKTLQDSHFKGGTAVSLMRELAAHPDAVLVSEETVKDFQLSPGDAIILRLQDAISGKYRNVDFRYVGVATKFPTAPRDSFLNANARYIAEQTHDPSMGPLLVDNGSNSPAMVAARIRAQTGTGVTVTDIQTSRKVVGSSLTAVDLAGLTRIELAFALLLAAAATGLVLWLGLAERRRTFAITAALGARPRQLGGFVWSEAGFVLVGGVLLGSLGSWILSEMLVRVLKGVFDPPPAAFSVPWGYLAVVGAVALVAVALAGTISIRVTRRPAVSQMRDS